MMHKRLLLLLFTPLFSTILGQNQIALYQKNDSLLKCRFPNLLYVSDMSGTLKISKIEAQNMETSRLNDSAFIVYPLNCSIEPLVINFFNHHDSIVMQKKFAIVGSTIKPSSHWYLKRNGKFNLIKDSLALNSIQQGDTLLLKENLDPIAKFYNPYVNIEWRNPKFYLAAGKKMVVCDLNHDYSEAIFNLNVIKAEIEKNKYKYSSKSFRIILELNKYVFTCGEYTSNFREKFKVETLTIY